MSTSLWSTRSRNLLALSAGVALGVNGMKDSRVPLLSYVDQGVHEAGQLAGTLLPVGAVVSAASGSVAQIALPLLLALYFFLLRPDQAGASLCLAWAATSTADVARYIADAPTQALPVMGGQHDWAFILGPDGVDSLDGAAGLASLVWSGAWMLLVLALGVPAWSLVRDLTRPTRRRRAASPSAPTGLDLRQNVDLRSHQGKSLDLRHLPDRSIKPLSKAVAQPVPAGRHGRRRPSV